LPKSLLVRQSHLPKKANCQKKPIANKRETRVLTEQEVARSWRRLFKDRDISTESVDKAEALLEELRPESPLRHRLGSELEEIRRLCEQP
jgi:hypothetical protein